MIEEREMERIFSETGRNYDYGKIIAEYVESKEFTIKWELRPTSLTFYVSDYVSYMPEDILRSIAGTIFARIAGHNTEPYGDEVREYLSSGKLAEACQDLYVRRHGDDVKIAAGRCKSLDKSYRRLVSKGLVEDDPQIKVYWADLHGSPYVGHNSVVMKIIMMNEELDSESVDDDVLDFALYTRIVHVALGFNTVGDYRGERYMIEIDKYGNVEKMKEKLAERMLKV